MLFPIGKLLQYLMHPFILGLALISCIAWLSWRRRDRVTAKLLVVTLLILGVPSLPVVPRILLRFLEMRYPPRPMRDYPTADLIFVLGGTATQTLWPRFEPEEIGGGRLYGAARLFQERKAPRILVVGGPPYLGTGNEKRTTALDMKQVIVGMGVAPEKIEMVDGSWNTQSDVRIGLEWMKRSGTRSVLLVTDAVHLRRSMVFFEGAGLEVTPVPVGRQLPTSPLSFYDFLPEVGALGATVNALKECVGYWVARPVAKQ